MVAAVAATYNVLGGANWRAAEPQTVRRTDALMEIYLSSDSDLHDLAETIRRALNLPLENQTPHQRDQRRNGLNWGGEYYLFESWGLELYLVRNAGEVEIPEMKQRFYILLAPQRACQLQSLAEHLAAILADHGLQTQVGDFAA